MDGVAPRASGGGRFAHVRLAVADVAAASRALSMSWCHRSLVQCSQLSFGPSPVACCGGRPVLFLPHIYGVFLGTILSPCTYIRLLLQSRYVR
jgi:hypothetical protein